MLFVYSYDVIRDTNCIPVYNNGCNNVYKNKQGTIKALEIAVDRRRILRYLI